jgi:hypothetical protein
MSSLATEVAATISKPAYAGFGQLAQADFVLAVGAVSTAKYDLRNRAAQYHDNNYFLDRY